MKLGFTYREARRAARTPLHHLRQALALGRCNDAKHWERRLRNLYALKPRALAKVKAAVARCRSLPRY